MDHAADVMTDLTMELDTAQEVNDLLHGTTLPGQDEIDAEAEDELAAMEAEMAAEAGASSAAKAQTATVAASASAASTRSTTTAAGAGSIGVTAASTLPSAPVHSVTADTPARDSVDDELAALEAEMA